MFKNRIKYRIVERPEYQHIRFTAQERKLGAWFNISVTQAPTAKECEGLLERYRFGDFNPRTVKEFKR